MLHFTPANRCNFVSVSLISVVIIEVKNVPKCGYHRLILKLTLLMGPHWLDPRKLNPLSPFMSGHAYSSFFDLNHISSLMVLEKFQKESWGRSWGHWRHFALFYDGKL